MTASNKAEKSVLSLFVSPSSVILSLCVHGRDLEGTLAFGTTVYSWVVSIWRLGLGTGGGSLVARLRRVVGGV